MAKNTPPGPAVDSSGQTVIDPTENVKALNAASIRHLDDLRRQDNAHHERERKLSAHYEKQLRKAERRSIRGQFKVWESNRVEQKTDTKVAVDAALSAAKEAVGKNEIFVKEQLAQQSSTTGEQIKAQGDKLDELKIRFERSEQFGAGGQAQRFETRSAGGQLWLVLGVVLAAFVGFGGLILTIVGIAVAAYFSTH